jgi:predicted Rossmann fold nucleotide-binding protein DprA/Smf involved in DNA uptake
MQRIAVIGSRSFDDYERLMSVLSPLLPAHIISGGAKGADGLAERLARELELPITVIKPDWAQFGRAAGPIRNREIVNAADIVIAFWDGKSKGTKSALDYARQQQKAVLVEEVNPE